MGVNVYWSIAGDSWDRTGQSHSYTIYMGLWRLFEKKIVILLYVCKCCMQSFRHAYESHTVLAHMFVCLPFLALSA